jgi:hypothetical protein
MKNSQVIKGVSYRCRLYANPDHARQQAHHDMRSVTGGLLEALQAGSLNVPDLTADEPTALHVVRAQQRTKDLRQAFCDEYSAQRADVRRTAEDQVRKEFGPAYELAEIDATLDRLMDDFEVRDRLDAMVERCLKRLLFLRRLKSISAASPSSMKPLAGPSRAV